MISRALVAALAALSLIAAACGSDDDESVTSESVTTESPIDTEPVDTEPVDTEPEAEEPAVKGPITTGNMASTPTRVISLHPAYTEIIVGIGAESLLVDGYPHAGLGEPEPAEVDIARLKPDLVLVGACRYSDMRLELDELGDIVAFGEFDRSDLETRVVAIGQATSIDSLYDEIDWLGELLGREKAVPALVDAYIADPPDVFGPPFPGEECPDDSTPAPAPRPTSPPVTPRPNTPTTAPTFTTTTLPVTTTTSPTFTTTTSPTFTTTTTTTTTTTMPNFTPPPDPNAGSS